MNISDTIFEGPLKINELKEERGVYSILCKDANGRYYVIDVGMTDNINERIAHHDREECWKRRCPNHLIYVKYLSSEEDCLNLEKNIRQKYNPPCGEK